MDQKNISIKDMKLLAAAKGGKCLSDNYINARTKLLWECNKGHTWLAIPDSIRRGSWCRFCAKNRKKTIEDMRALAKSKGGKCLSEEYENVFTSLKWQCSEGHIWESAANNIIQGAWCHICGRIKAGLSKRLGLDIFKKADRAKGGICLSTEYVGLHSKLQFKCKNGHVFSAEPASILHQGSWCRTCYGTEKKTIEEMHKIAADRNGKCLSKNYVNAYDLLKWQCSNNHIFKKRYSDIYIGQWCPECSRGLGERICKAYFEYYFFAEFKKAYPKWLVSSSKTQLELDGYNEALGIAFEHQGEQHYTTATMFITTEKELEKRKIYDALKRKLCRENKVLLFEIPEIIGRLSLHDVPHFISELIIAKGVECKKDRLFTEVPLKFAYSPDRLKEIQDIAIARKGVCLSNVYLGANTKIPFKCQYGHEWQATPGKIKSGAWCHQCSPSKRKTIEDMRMLAKRKEGECLSDVYVNSKSKLKWKCKSGHIWEALPTNISRGKWCPICGDRQRWETRRKNFDR